MKIIFVKNAFLGGHRYTAGESTEVSEALADHLEGQRIVHVERPAVVEEPKPAPASPAQKKKTAARKKAVAK